MFSFLKPRTSDSADGTGRNATDTPAQDTSTSEPSRAPDESPRTQTGAKEVGHAEHPLAAMVWDTPDVPRVDNGPQVSAHGLDVGALLEPQAESTKPAHFGDKDRAKTDELKPAVVEALSTIYDPEIPVNIYELGLIYDIVSDAEGHVLVTMTLTSPACPSAQQLPAEAKFKTKAVPGVTDAHVDVVWEPTWTKDMMSETARLALGMF